METNRTLKEKFRNLMLITNIGAGSLFAMAAGFFCSQTAGYNCRMTVFGVNINSFAFGVLGVSIGATIVGCSIWKIQELRPAKATARRRSLR